MPHRSRTRCRPVYQNSRQKEPNCRYLRSALPVWRRVQALSKGRTLDKMMERRKTRNAGFAAGSDRKHLTRREVDQLLQAVKGGRNEARDRCLLLVMYRHGLRVSEACGLKLGPGRRRQSSAARRPAEARAIDGPSASRRRAPGDRRLAEGTGAYENAGRGEDVLRKRTAQAATPVHRQSAAGEVQRRFLALARTPAHAAARLRLRAGRPGGGHPADSGLPWTPKHSAHRTVYSQ